MRIYLGNNPAQFHPDPIWNDEALNISEQVPQNNKEKNNKMSSDMRWVADPKIAIGPAL